MPWWINVTIDKHISGAIDWASLVRLVDDLPHATSVVTPDGDVICENRAFQALRHSSVPMIPLTGFLQTLPPRDRDALARLTRQDTSESSALQLGWSAPGVPAPSHTGQFTRLALNDKFAGFLCQLTPLQSVQSPRLQYLMENLDQGVWDYDLKTGEFTASDAWFKLRGIDVPHDIDMSNEDWLHNVHPEDRDGLRNALYGQKAGDQPTIVVQYRHRHTDGSWVWILCRASVVSCDASGLPIRIIGTDTDISDAMASRKEMQQLASKLTLAVEASGMGIWEFDPVTNSVHWDDRLLEIYGIEDGQNLRSGTLWETYLHPDDYAETVAYSEECLRNNRDVKFDFRIVRPDGVVRHIRSLARNVDPSNAMSKLIGVNIDVTEDYQRAYELEIARSQLEHDALHDELTGLGNRRALDKVSSELFNRVAATGRYAVMQIDLDHFKAINDTLGHPAGDFVLTAVASILRHHIGEAGQVFRLGGDEFAVILEQVPEADALNQLCQTLITEVSAPMTFEGQPCSVGASIGYAVGQGPPASQSAIFVEADTALYAAKRAGRFTYRAYTDEIGKDFHQAPKMNRDLRDALDAQQFVCHLQPQYDARSLNIVGAEALVRWNCPTRGLLAPGQFLLDATDAGLVGKIDRYIFERIADLQTEWHDQGTSYPRVSVNVSRERLEDEDLIRQTQDVLQDHHRFCFELLETTFYDTPTAEFLFKLDALREMGIRIEMDDFGTGHASVSALQVIKPDAVKIDRRLVAPIGAYANQLEILHNLSRIARLQDAQVVVEGLENGTHMAAIRTLDCDVLQGYVLQRPMAEIEFASLIAGPDIAVEVSSATAKAV